MRKILFLDVDGVLNQCGKSGQGLATEQCQHLRTIVERVNPEIVLSSTWRRTDHQRARIEKLLASMGTKLSGCTPDDNTPTASGLFRGVERFREIEQWLAEDLAEEEDAAVVILDDEPDMGRLQYFLVKTESDVGLTTEIADQVVSKFTDEV